IVDIPILFHLHLADRRRLNGRSLKCNSFCGAAAECKDGEQRKNNSQFHTIIILLVTKNHPAGPSPATGKITSPAVDRPGKNRPRPPASHRQKSPPRPPVSQHRKVQ